MSTDRRTFLKGALAVAAVGPAIAEAAPIVEEVPWPNLPPLKPPRFFSCWTMTLQGSEDFLDRMKFDLGNLILIDHPMTGEERLARIISIERRANEMIIEFEEESGICRRLESK